MPTPYRDIGDSDLFISQIDSVGDGNVEKLGKIPVDVANFGLNPDSDSNTANVILDVVNFTNAVNNLTNNSLVDRYVKTAISLGVE